jgi:ubiquinone/menaquinone biosynthesis C-methylase UbiE
MNYEKEYYEYDGFWNNREASIKFNHEKIQITFEFLQPDVKSVLDAACGNGVFTNLLAEKFPNLNIVAFDRSEAALKYVKTKKRIAEIDNIPFNNGEFDCVIAHDVIEHLPVSIYKKALCELARVAKKYIIIAVPFNEDVLVRSTQCPSCKAIFNYDLHMRSFTKEKMTKLFSDSGFVCKDIRTCDKNTFYFAQEWYGRLMYPKINKRFKSPICPICGYTELISNMSQDPRTPKSVVPIDKGFVKLIKDIPKLFWPKYSFDYEMVALFEKNV